MYAANRGSEQGLERLSGPSVNRRTTIYQDLIKIPHSSDLQEPIRIEARSKIPERKRFLNETT